MVINNKKMSVASTGVNDLLNLMQPSSQEDRELISRAFRFAQNLPGSDLNRAFETAHTLAKLGMDVETIAAGLLYNVLEDERVDESQLKQEFGEEITCLIKGVTELNKHRYHGLERHKESLRKLLLAISEDIRVLIIKLAERLHRFETLPDESDDKQKRTALETLEIYAPIAHRLRMGQIKGELEDLAFPYVYPKEYEETKELLREKSKETQKYLEKVHRSLQKILFKENIQPIATDYRIKHLYSLYKKLHRYDMNIEKIYDIAALRIVVSSVSECYQILGIIHGVWQPTQGRIKDYIASPKPNWYQSLHTTIATGDGGIVEIQIRTEKMHREAEFGIASYLAYKELPKEQPDFLLGKKFSWIRELVRWQKNFSESKKDPENFRVDFFKDRVFVFTPQGDVIDLPHEATPVDFAYAIHSDVGDFMSGAKVNGKLSSLDTKLQNGDVVDIVTKKRGSPSPKWFEYAKTPLAKKHIKAALSKISNL